MKKIGILTFTWAATMVLAYFIGSSNSGHTALRGEHSILGPAAAATPTSLRLNRTDLKELAAKDSASESDTVPLASIDALSQKRIQELALEAVRDPNPLKRSLAFSRMLESITPETAPLMMQSLMDERADRDELRLFRYAWASIDPEGAIQQAMTYDDKRRQHDALEESITGWASTSPEEAMAWVDAIEDPKERERFRDDLVSGMADHDIAGATDYVVELAAAGDQRADDYLEDVAREQLRNGNLQHSVQWAEDLPEGELRGQAMDAVANRYVNQDPEAAAAWAARYAEEDYAARVVEEVGDEWAERDPVASVDWLASLPEGRGQREGIHSALGEWARDDPTAASSYLANLDSSPFRDAAASGFSRAIARENPTAAIAWAEAIGETEARINTLTRVAQDWYRRDAEAAAVWLESSGLPQEAVTSVLDSRNRRR